MNSTGGICAQEYITPEASDRMAAFDDMADGQHYDWLASELADTAAWLESNLHQFAEGNRATLSHLADSLRECAETARNTQNIARAGAATLPGRMGPLEREVRGLGLWLCSQAAGGSFDGREKLLLKPLYRHLFGIAGQCCALEHIAEPGQSEEVREDLKSLNIPTPKIREE